MRKRAFFRSPLSAAALIAVLVWSLTPVTGAALSRRVRPKQNNRHAERTTLARVAEVKVTAGPTGVLIEWRTSFEIDNLGFNIYREQSGTRTRVNPSMIAGSALVVGQGTPMYAGNSYSWIDSAGTADSVYFLEDINLNEARALNGPFKPVWSDTLSQNRQSALLSELSNPSGDAQTGGPASIFGRSLAEPAAISDQWLIAAQGGLKIGVKQEGWYRITQPELLAAGFDVTADSRNLRLFVNARETAIEVSRTSGPLSPSDFIEFYGLGIDVPTTDTRVYYLINGAQAGLRVPIFGELHPNAIPSPSPAPTLSGTPQSDRSKVTLAPWFSGIFGNVAALKEDGQPQPVAETQAAAPSVALDLKTGNDRSDQIDQIDRGDNAPAASRKQLLARAEIGAKTTKRTPVVPVARDAPKAATPALLNRHRPARGREWALPRLNTKLRSRGSSLSDPVTAKPDHRHHQKHRRRTTSFARKRNHTSASVAASAGYLYTAQRKERTVYFTALLNGDAENFFGNAVTGTPLVETLNLSSVQIDSRATAQLQIALQGTSNQAHLVSVFLNDVMIGSMSFSFQDYLQQTFDLSPSQLREGANTIKLVQGSNGDVSLVDYLRLTYPKAFHADNGSLAFTNRANQTATVDGFTSAGIRVLDISDPNAVQEVQPIVSSAGSNYTVTVPATGVNAKGSRNLLALSSTNFLHPASIATNQPSTLNSASNQGDLLIISHPDFIASLAPLVAQRQAQGFTVKVASIDDVYDEFSYGLHNGQAIKDFLARASVQWTKPPKYVLLVGDGSYDPRNYFGLGSFDFVPTKMIDTVFMETGSDDTLADFDGEGIPEIPVGRLAVRTPAEADREVFKIVNFSPANVPQTAVMVADTQGSYYFNFEQASDQVAAFLPPGMSVQKVYRRLEPSDSAARADIINKINSGAALVNYAGHGTVDVWTGAPIFSASDALALTNGSKLPLVLINDCLNGYFVAPAIDCVGESLMKAPNGGAVASFASSGLTIPDGQHEMAQKLFHLLYDTNSPPIALGDATRQAKSATTDIDVRRTWILFGDPTMKIR